MDRIDLNINTVINYCSIFLYFLCSSFVRLPRILNFVSLWYQSLKYLSPLHVHDAKPTCLISLKKSLIKKKKELLKKRGELSAYLRRR